MNITRKERLIKLMTKENLTAKEVGKILNRSKKTVQSWRSKRNVPHWVLPTLLHKLERQQR